MLTDEHEHAMKVADQAYSAGNLVTCDGYYEFDLDAAAAVIAADRAGLVAEIERLREALSLDAVRFEHCAEMIAKSFEASGTLRAERTIKAEHYALEARAALKDTRHET